MGAGRACGCAEWYVCILDNDNHNDDSRAGLSGVEIDAHNVVQREESALIAAKSDGGRHAVLQKGDERDLNALHSVRGVTLLHEANRALDCGPRLDGTTDEYIAAAG